MDIFADVLRHNHALFRTAAASAALQLGLFQVLSETEKSQSYDLASIAANLNLPLQRLRPLLYVLAAEGHLHRTARVDGDQFRLVSVPQHSDVSAGDWDRIAEVISTDRPIEVGTNWLKDHLQYVDAKGQYAAPILWKAIDPKPGSCLLDVGGGLGSFSRTFLNRHPDNRATLVDLPETLDLLTDSADEIPHRLDLAEGDARESLPGSGYDVVLLANVLHLFGARDCAQIVQNAADAAAPGGTVVVKDVYVSPDRSGPLVGLYFALNMALYSEAGDVHPTAGILSWLREAGLTEVKSLQIARLDGSTVVTGKRQRS